MSSNLNRQLQEAISLAQSGRAREARTLLLSIVQQNPNFEMAWMWLATVALSSRERLSYLTRVLTLNPQNTQAATAYQQLTGIPWGMQGASGSSAIPIGVTNIGDLPPIDPSDALPVDDGIPQPLPPESDPSAHEVGAQPDPSGSSFATIDRELGADELAPIGDTSPTGPSNPAQRMWRRLTSDQQAPLSLTTYFVLMTLAAAVVVIILIIVNQDGGGDDEPRAIQPSPTVPLVDLSPTPTRGPSLTPSLTALPTNTPGPSPTSIWEVAPPTWTPRPSLTPPPTRTTAPSLTPFPTYTDTLTPRPDTATFTPLPPTQTFTYTPSNTASPKPTETATVTQAPSATPTRMPSATPVPTRTATPQPSATPQAADDDA